MTALRKPTPLPRMPQTDEELWWFVFAMWGVKIPRHSVCPGHVAPFTAFADAYFARYPVAVWKASRGFGGKTQMLSILGMTELIALGSEVTILGGSGAQSLRVHETMREAWNYHGAPTQLLSRDPTKYDTYLKNGGHARTLMASTKSVRGPHPQRMRLDEIDEMEERILSDAQGQPMRKKNKQGVIIETNTVLSSTHQYPDGTMTKTIARAKEQGWPVMQWCYKESSNPIDGWLKDDEIERKRGEITKAMWEAEYDLQEPNFEGRAIDGASVDRMFDPGLGVASGAEGKFVVVEHPRRNRDYITGVDWAKSKDFTVIVTWDATEDPWRMVAFERLQRRPWPAMIARLNKRLEDYGGKVAHDATGIGSVVDDYIEIPRSMHPRDVKAIVMHGRDRSDMINNYVSAIERGLLKAPRIMSMYDEHRFATPDDLFNGSSTSHLPDSIAASTLAWSLHNTWSRVAAPVVSDEMTRSRSPWKIGR